MLDSGLRYLFGPEGTRLSQSQDKFSNQLWKVSSALLIAQCYMSKLVIALDSREPVGNRIVAVTVQYGRYPLGI